jgi:UDP-N-acetylmuramoyl-tripeptide--D-alanyl-D-alanine ligase
MLTQDTKVTSVAGKTTLSLAQVATQLGVELIGEDVNFSQINVNTRTLQPGDLFVAIRGDHFDAHQFIKQAAAKGACGLVVETDINLQLPGIIVKDTRLALGYIASLWRSCFSLPVVAVTGSCGKTTVKEMISAIFNVRFGEKVLSTRGNLNNEIGVPLTLMRLNNEHQVAVIEMGANHQGEIAHLVNLLQPDIAVITNCAHAHIEGFGSIDNVAKAKGEIFSSLVNTGTAIINADDEYADYWIKLCQTITKESGRQLEVKTFGLNDTADVSATYHQTEAELAITLTAEQGTATIYLHQLGKHNVYNALAATAVTLAAGCELREVKQGLESFINVSGRLEHKQGINGSLIFDDTYNANPDSVKAGIEAIHHIPGNMIVILGDMAELGESSESIHYQLGTDLAEWELAQLYTFGQLSQATCKGFNHSRSKKHKTESAHCFATKEELIKALSKEINSSSVILVKGSRSMGMESVVAAIELDQNKKLRGCHSCC